MLISITRIAWPIAILILFSSFLHSLFQDAFILKNKTENKTKQNKTKKKKKKPKQTNKTKKKKKHITNKKALLILRQHTKHAQQFPLIEQFQSYEEKYM